MTMREGKAAAPAAPPPAPRFSASTSGGGGESTPRTPKPKVPVIVGVAGASGSGKTCIASLIAERLPLKVVSISSDNYYFGIPAGVDASQFNWDAPAALDFALLASHLRALGRGEDVRVPHYDFARHARAEGDEVECTTFISARETDVVILDGIFVLAVEDVKNACDLTLFTTEDLDVCLARRLRRDIAERGRDVDSVLQQYLRFVKPGFHTFIAPSMNHADILVPRARDNETAIEMVSREVQRRVEAAVALSIAP